MPANATQKKKKIVQSRKSNAEPFINSKEEKNFMAITHKFRSFTILLIKIVSPQNKN